MSEQVLRWKDLVIKYALPLVFPPSLVLAIMEAESGGNEKAVSRAGARGLLQVMTFHFKDGEDTLDPDTNIRVGVSFLYNCLTNLNYDFVLAVAAYNAGVGAVQKYNGIPPFAETQSYVQIVGRNVLNYLSVDQEIMFLPPSYRANAPETFTFKEAFSNSQGIINLLSTRIQKFKNLNEDVH